VDFADVNPVVLDDGLAIADDRLASRPARSPAVEMSLDLVRDEVANDVVGRTPGEREKRQNPLRSVLAVNAETRAGRRVKPDIKADLGAVDAKRLGVLTERRNLFSARLRDLLRQEDEDVFSQLCV
jgi:hypothetical protein